MNGDLTLNTGEIQHGSYHCVRCGTDYTVNKPDSWQRCTPSLCHDCTSRLDRQMNKMPVEWAGRWCEPGPMGCACLGCANNSGGLRGEQFTKADWQEWKARFSK